MTQKELHIFYFTGRGESIATKVASLSQHSFIYSKEELIKAGGLKKKVASLFRNNPKTGRAMVFVSATGIAVRVIAPNLKDKATDPAVVVVDDHANFAISLVSGHLGGANELALEIGRITGATPIITTATDIAGLPCIEDLSKRFSFTIEDTRKIKLYNAAILRGEKIRVVDGNKERLASMKGAFAPVKDACLSSPFLFRQKVKTGPDADDLTVIVSTMIHPAGATKKSLLLRPKEFVVGMGCRKGVTIKEVREAFDKTLEEYGISPLSVANFATTEIKSEEKGLLGFARQAGLEIDFIDSQGLWKASEGRVPNKVVIDRTGLPGVAEEAALASSGAKKLWIKKRKFKRVTIAAARIPFTKRPSTS